MLTLDQPELVVYDGWYDFEREGSRSWRWAHDVAATGIMVPTTREIQLSYAAYSLKEGELVLELDGREVNRHRTSPDLARREHRSVEAARRSSPAGVAFHGPVVRPAWADGRRLGFAVENLRLSDLTAANSAISTTTRTSHGFRAVARIELPKGSGPIARIHHRSADAPARKIASMGAG